MDLHGPAGLSNREAQTHAGPSADPPAGSSAEGERAGVPAFARRFGDRPTAISTPRPSEELDLRRLAASVQIHVEGGDVPAMWRRPGVAAEVDTGRAHLEPPRSRVLLSFAYARETERIARLRELAVDPARPAPPPSAVDLAYAVRWLELGSVRRALPPWLTWLHGAAPPEREREPEQERGHQES